MITINEINISIVIAVAVRAVVRDVVHLVGKIFRNIVIFPIFRHLAKMEKQYRRFGYKIST